jgi:hypothetical protein
VIAVQVRDKHRVDVIRINTVFAHCDQARGIAVDQECISHVLHKEAGVEPATAAECVAAAKEL